MSNHTPKKPSVDNLKLFSQWNIKPKEGKVFNLQGKELGSIDKNKGYWFIHYKGKHVKRTHLVWWTYTGEWPTEMIDHENRKRHDDRIENLKSKTSRENIQNSKYKERELPTGVSVNKNRKTPTYFAQIMINYKKTYLGTYKTPEEASKAYERAKVNEWM